MLNNQHKHSFATILYDDIGLLKPAQRSEAGYRLYSEHDLICLQQGVTLKFLGFSLADIKEI
jgi:7-cyano-7-deazaguanine reductase